MGGDYDGAAYHDKIANLLQTLAQKAEQQQLEARVLDQLYQRWQNLQQTQQEINSRWDSTIQSFIDDSARQELALQAKHEEELDGFVEQWKDPMFVRQFSKPSAKLVELREQERSLGISRMYGQAKEVKALADRMQREETNAAQARINAQMSLEREVVAVRQEKELISLAAHRDRTLKGMQSQKEKELRPVLTAIQQIKAKKLSIHKTQSSLPSLPPGRANTSSGRYLNVTQARYAQFRMEKRRVLLDVAPVDDQMIAQMKRPTTTRVRTALRATAK
jgi:hypothetical protein